jgi:hypothetical protein
MYRSENARDAVERDPRNDPRTRSRVDGETVVERNPIIADGHREPADTSTSPERRRTERRRIERMGTDI